MNSVNVGLGGGLWVGWPEGKKIGGAHANFAYHVSQLGFDGYAVSAIGQDSLGDGIVQVFDEKKLHYQLPRVDFPTGTVQVTLDAQGVPCYDIRQQVARDNIPFTEEMKQLAARTSVVCFGSLAQRNLVCSETITRFIDSILEVVEQLKISDIIQRQHFNTEEIITE